MLLFKDITLSDKDLIQSFTLNSRWQNCDLTFANLCSWRFLYHTQYAVMDGYVIFRFRLESRYVYMMPVGAGDMKPILEAMMEDAWMLGVQFNMLGVTYEMRTWMENVMPRTFRFSENRDYYDYVYRRTDLASLTGKKYQAKRNFLNRFRKEYPEYEYRQLTKDLIPECIRLAERWRMMNDEGEDEALGAELQSLTFALKYMDELDVMGGALCVDGRLVAFAYGAAINQNTWDICVEKADTNYEGAYAMINYEYANHLPEQYVYINREEDLGLPGLRKAKLSYQPYLLLEKYVAELI